MRGRDLAQAFEVRDEMDGEEGVVGGEEGESVDGGGERGGEKEDGERGDEGPIGDGGRGEVVHGGEGAEESEWDVGC